MCSHVQVFCVDMFLILLGMYPSIELLSPVVTLCLISWGTIKSFSTEATPFYISTNNL